jgi:4-hydroxy-3-polyprenylbenzoate decarboxylase
MNAALGLAASDDLAARIEDLLKGVAGETVSDKLLSLSVTAAWSCHAPELVHDGPCREVAVEPVDLNRFPFPKSWPHDGEPDHAGRFMTLPIVITRGRDGRFNCGMYRVAILGKDRAAIHWSPQSGGARHAAEWSAAGEPMPVAITFGGPPALVFAATLPLPEAIDEFSFAGMLQRTPVEVVTALHGGLIVPAGAELVIEGVIEPGSSAGDGAFGNHTGYYVPSSPSPVLRVTSVTHRHGMIVPVTVVGPPPMEDCWIAAAAGRLLLGFLRVDLPAVVDLYQPVPGIFHGATVVSVQNGAGNGLELLSAIRKTPWFARSRFLVLVDSDQDPSDESGVFWRVMNNVEWHRDLVIEEGFLGIDATAKNVPGKPGRVPVTMDEEVTHMIGKRWQEYGFNDDI